MNSNVKRTQGFVKKDFNIIKNDFESMGLELLTNEKDYINTITPMNYICKNHRNKGIQMISYSSLRKRMKKNKYGCRECDKEYREKLKAINIKCGIYKITNVKNNKVYIGKSKDIYSRWSAHIREFNNQIHKNPHFQRAWNKYGKDSFKFEIIEECTENEINEKEIYYIALYNATDQNIGYNLRDGGEGGSLTDDVKKRMSISQRGLGSSLTSKDVRRIKMCLFLGISRSELSEMYNVSIKVITSISIGDSYYYILPELNGKMTKQKEKALEERNNEILKLFDSGMSKAEIVHQLGHSYSIVEKCINKFRDVKIDKSESIYLYNRSMELYDQGMNYYDIGKLLGIQTRRVKRYIENNRVPGQDPSNKKVSDDISQYIFDKFFKDKVTIKDITKTLDVSRNCVETEINKYLYANKSTPFTHERCALFMQ